MTPEDLQMIRERVTTAANANGRLDVHVDLVLGLLTEIEQLQAQSLKVDEQIARIHQATAKFIDYINELCAMLYRWGENAPGDPPLTRREETAVLLARLGWNPATGKCE